ncbi:hypothetical protein [Ruegeria sp. HKCCD7221]|uniref:hypothetical protein n=1 Tax=Ruegeria sp. HKCCD7221 TaxID=2683009 RepID=UPI00148848CB|nr:hypothetical protein [Ruegeria sp. HKCCD7221]
MKNSERNIAKPVSERVRFVIAYLLASPVAAMGWHSSDDMLIVVGTILLFIVSLWHVDRLNRNWFFSLLGVVPISALLLLFLPKNKKKEDSENEEWRALMKLLITVTAFIAIFFTVGFTQKNGSLF